MNTVIGQKASLITVLFTSELIKVNLGIKVFDHCISYDTYRKSVKSNCHRDKGL
jgi:hypothetical protein